MLRVSLVFHTIVPLIDLNNVVVSIEFSPLSTVELTTNWYQLHNGDYREISESPKVRKSENGEQYFGLSVLSFDICTERSFYYKIDTPS